jgi:hypothetical protein
MKRIVTMLSGTVLASALSFGAQAPTNSAPATSSAPSVPAAKKHEKKHKKAAKANSKTAPAASATPVKK